MTDAICRLKAHWNSMGIENIPADELYISKVSKSINLPKDFRELFAFSDGMYHLYPNYTDDEGFLFHPLQSVRSLSSMYPESQNTNGNNIYIFANYMLKCWLYGYKVINEFEYEIGLIPNNNEFLFITSSLSEFISLYIEDSEDLYLK